VEAVEGRCSQGVESTVMVHELQGDRREVWLLLSSSFEMTSNRVGRLRRKRLRTGMFQASLEELESERILVPR